MRTCPPNLFILLHDEIQLLDTAWTKRLKNLTSWSRTVGEPSGEVMVMLNLAVTPRTSLECAPS